jgi:hypothetical protein
VKLVAVGLIATAIVVVAMSHSLNDPPAYEAAPLESTTKVVKVPSVGGEVAADPGPVRVGRVRVVENPGGRPPRIPLVHWTAPVENAPAVARFVPHPGDANVNNQPVGARTVIEVIAYAFVAGFVTFTVNGVTVVP